MWNVGAVLRFPMTAVSSTDQAVFCLDMPTNLRSQDAGMCA